MKKLLSFAILPIIVFCSALFDSCSKPTITEINEGEKFIIDGIEFTVNGAMFKKYAEGGSYEAGDNLMWLIIKATLYNNSSDPVDIEDFIYVELKYINGDKSVTYNSRYFYNDYWIYAHSEIVPYEKIDGVFTFKIPTNIAPDSSTNEEKTDYFEFRLIKRKNPNQVFVFKI